MIRVLPLIFVVGCGFLDAEGDPVIEAHRGASGNWPQNSRTAMINSIEGGYDGLEFDLVLTADRVPILAHDPWLHDPLCTLADGSDIPKDVRIDSLTLEQVENDYVCGGKKDPDFPSVEPIEDTIMTFDELLIELEANPDIVVHIDVKYEPGLTLAPDIFAQEILSRWDDAALPNRWYASANTEEMMLAMEYWGNGRPLEVETHLSWPYFAPNSNATPVALAGEFSTALGTTDLVNLIRRSNADGIMLPWQVASRRQADEVVDNGYAYSLWTVNEESQLKAFSKWPLHSLITDFPERAPK